LLVSRDVCVLLRDTTRFETSYQAHRTRPYHKRDNSSVIRP